MAFYDSGVNQLRSVIEWDSNEVNTLFFRWSQKEDEIKNASKLIIKAGQGCIFVYRGKVEAVFDKEGVFEIKTDNIPFITTIFKLMQGFESEHKTGFYFYRKTIFTDQKWGTVSPIKYIDSIYGFPVELIGFGNYSLQIKNPKNFFTSIVGDRAYFEIDELKDIINSRLTQPISYFLGSSKISYNEIDSQREEITEAIQEKINNDFEILGFTLIDFRIEGTQFDSQTKERISKIADTQAKNFAAKKVGIDYTKMRQLDALEEASKNEGGSAGILMGANAGNILSSNINIPTNQPLSIEDRLLKLKKLFDSNLINEEEYSNKKQDILKDL